MEPDVVGWVDLVKFLLQQRQGWVAPWGFAQTDVVFGDVMNE